MQLLASLFIYIQLHAEPASYDWQVVKFQMRAEWRSAWTMYGVLCVPTFGDTMMPLLFANNLTIQLKVSVSTIYLQFCIKSFFKC